MPRRPRINWPLNLGLSGLFLLLGMYIAWPMIGYALGWGPWEPGLEISPFSMPPDPGEESRERAVTIMATGWFFVLGASIGSFLNVVAYRMPMGLTFVSKPSRCPYCETPIEFKHNVPILGWLVLRGRCNACRLPISPRYIFVELFVGILFLTLFLTELASGGRNLPFREPNQRSGLMWNLFTPSMDLIGIYCYHVFLLAILATIALIRFDRLKVPARLAFFTLAMGVSLRWVWPDLCVVPAFDWLSSSPSIEQFNTRLPFNLSVARLSSPLVDLLIGYCAGSVAQFVINRADRSEQHSLRGSPASGVALALSLVGVYCGSLAIGWMFFFAAVFRQLVGVLGRANRRSTDSLWTMMCLIGAWITLCFWRQLTIVGAGQFDSPWPFSWLLFAIGLGAAFVAQWIEVPQLDSQEAQDADATDGLTAD